MEALKSLSDGLGKQGVIGEICLFRGTVMVLAFTARVSTEDVEALFRPLPLVRDLAPRMAEEHGLPADWLDDGVKGYVSAKHETTPGNLPQFAHLRLTMPVPEYLLAMKCMAARLGGTTGEPTDIPDIVFLVRHLRLRSAREVLEIVAQYYPANLVPVAEELARRYDLVCPRWSSEETRRLHRPWFATPLSALRAVLILESPPGFRARILFVSENALSRA